MIRDAVCELLTWAIRLFEDSDTVRRRTGYRALLSGREGLQISPVVSGSKKTSAVMKMRWAISGKRKSEKLLQDLSFFVDKLHEFVPISGEVVPLEQPVQATYVLRLTGGSHRVESRARRTRKHAKRIAIRMEKKLKQIRVNERKRLERQTRLFLSCATFGGVSGTFFFFAPLEQLL
ncbi:hypothetical protein K440DRAFT_19082 [Wilcoxina mikolae CBS 423.85]|nr:hypothetical protein K440DRAFT_19082 [Wilcoxina mikolae CBS 423.85]